MTTDVSSATGTYPFPVADPFTLPERLAWLREHEPVTRVRVATGDEVWLVTSYDDVRAVLGDRRFSRNIFRPDGARLIPGVPVRQLSAPFVDPPAHTRWRKLVGRAFTPRHVEGMRDRVQAVVDDLLDAVERAGPPADLMRALAQPLPVTVICELFGISLDQHEPFTALAEVALTVNDAPMERKTAAFGEMAQFARDLVAAKRASPGDDFLSKLIGVHDEDDGQLSEDELVATILTIFIGGYESTVNQIGKALLALFRFPDQLALVRERPELIGAAVEETLRYAALDSGYGSPRYALDDVEVGGATIPRGSTVLVLRASANRDPATFDDAEQLVVERGHNPHVAFGSGPHVCLGSALARLELEVGLGTLLRRFPDLALAVPAAEVPWDYRITVAGPATLPVTW